MRRRRDIYGDAETTTALTFTTFQGNFNLSALNFELEARFFSTKVGQQLSMAVEREVRGATVGEVEVLYGHHGAIRNFKMPQTRETGWKDRVEWGRKLKTSVGLDSLMKGAGAAGYL